MSIKMKNPGKGPTGKCRTKQEFKKLADVNEVAKRFMQTGFIDHLAAGQPVFADVSRIPDLHQTMCRVRQAEEAFMRLDPSIRRRFDNRMHKMVEFLADPENKDEAIRLGIKKKPEGWIPPEDRNKPPKPVETQPKTPPAPLVKPK